MKTLLSLLLLSLSLAGCKQGPGERCQVNSDCAEGNCSQAEPKVCGGDDSAQFDAAPIPTQIDAPDAPAPIDAGVDAGAEAGAGLEDEAEVD
ncbi:MAG: hypothetical protein H7138_26130 [Myxococcales bacterium]|nr:hypothetical protein [Myxococcales bacterium]